MEEIKQKASWEEEFEKTYVKQADFYSGRPEPINWLCPFVECSAESMKEFISQALQKRDSQIIKMLENTDVQMSVNGDVSQDEIAMVKFIYKAHIRHIIKKIESAIIPPNSINGTLPSETDSATK